MTDFLNKSSVLVLNSLFQCIGTVSPKQAMISLNSSYDQITPASRVIDVIYKKDENGKLNPNELDYWQVLTFEEWTLVEPRDGIDRIIRTANLCLRCPTVILTNYTKVPMKRLRPTKDLLYRMQNGRCAYSNEKTPIKKLNFEHLTPKSFGGKDTFENLLLVKPEINSRRGNRDLKELGLVPLFNHKSPKPIPVSYTIKNCVHFDWRWFIGV